MNCEKKEKDCIIANVVILGTLFYWNSFVYFSLWFLNIIAIILSVFFFRFWFTFSFFFLVKLWPRWIVNVMDCLIILHLCKIKENKVENPSVITLTIMWILLLLVFGIFLLEGNDCKNVLEIHCLVACREFSRIRIDRITLCGSDDLREKICGKG